MQKGNIENNEQLSQTEKEKLQTASDIAFANFEKNLKENVLKEVEPENNTPFPPMTHRAL